MRYRWPTALKRFHIWLNEGSAFKRYAPQAPSAPASDRHKLAICNLIPNLGDAVMIFPLLDALQRENPNIEISLFTHGAGQLLGAHPVINHLYVMETPRKNSLSSKAPLVHILSWWWKHWRHLNFHTVVVLRGGVDPHRSHHLAWLLGGTRRIAYSPALEPERPECQLKVEPLFTDLVAEMHEVHEVNRGYEVLNLAGFLREPIPLNRCVDSLLSIANSASSQIYLQHLGLNDQAYAVIALGASVPRRAWSSAAFAELTLNEIVRHGWHIVLVGGADTAERAKRFKSLIPQAVLDVTGKTNFEQLVAICGGARCFVGNDSGPAHIAGACGVPTLVITAFACSGLKTHHASPARSRPLGPHVAVAQPVQQLSPCTAECIADTAHCIDQVSVEESASALRRLLANASANKDGDFLSQKVFG